MSTVQMTAGTKKREELQLPILHFIAADDWMDKLGNDAFCAWLKFYSWCDRSARRNNLEQDVVPTSFNKIIKRLGVSKEKFYKKILPALWDYGLIDLKEYGQSGTNGQKPMNIIVYDAPQNQAEKRFKPLEKLRDYMTEYTSNARTFAKQGGRKKLSKKAPEKAAAPETTPEKTTPESKGGGSEIEPGVVRKSNRGGSEIEPNNVSKVTNASNNINNVSNLITETSIENTGLPMAIQKRLMMNRDRLIDDNISLQSVIDSWNLNEDDFTPFQYAAVLEDVLQGTKKKIGNFPKLMKKSLTNAKNNEEISKKEKPMLHPERKLPKWLQD